MTACTAASLSAKDSKIIALTRRHVIQTLLALCAGGVCLLGHSANAAPFRTVWNNDNHNPTPENFAMLCAFITLQDDLDPQSMKAVYEKLMDEPWGPSHITRLHTKIGAALERDPSARDKTPLHGTEWQFDDGEKWFARHVLEIWYTGCYENAERPSARMLYEGALMYRAVAGVLNVPMVEPLGFGNWEKPPS
ncbi:MAG: sugar dehydrogenase complex small subunit [bacterium]|nr:sugar dehydrogenase complex small subunit [bacterium]